MLELSSEGCVQNRQRALGARKEGLQARDIASAKALGLEKRKAARDLLGWARGVSSPRGAAPAAAAAAASSFILVHHRRHRHQDVQPSGLPGSQSRRELVHSLR